MVQILIDHQSPNYKFAWTINTQKISIIRNLLRLIPFSNAVRIVGTDGRTISLFSIGRYITIVSIAPVKNKYYR